MRVYFFLLLHQLHHILFVVGVGLFLCRVLGGQFFDSVPQPFLLVLNFSQLVIIMHNQFISTCMEQTTIEKPGPLTELPPQILAELALLDEKFRKRITFFGGHPISMTRNEYQNIFDESCVDRMTNLKISPYLVCQKTDGVRFLLIITNDKNYFVSREGSKNLVPYEADIRVSNKWAINSPQFKTIVHILDGEMIKDSKPQERMKYLIFDALVCFGINIIKRPLKYRLNEVTKVCQCNKFLLDALHNGGNKSSIEMIIKDFFRLSCTTYASSSILRKHNIDPPTTVQFLFATYIKNLPHENDGIIFNHEEKQYILGTNPGYVKWKPPHLNTVDFLVTPNTNLSDRFGNRVLDLYLGEKDSSNIYRKLFYTFAVVEQDEFNRLLEREEQMYEAAISNENFNIDVTDEFFGLIAECKFELTNENEQKIFKELYSRNRTAEEIRDDIMKKSIENREMEVMVQLQNQTYIKSWKIYKIRSDKNMPNNHSAALKIENSIKDDIKAEALVTGNRKLLQKLKV